MNMPLFCPLCDAQLIRPGRIAVFTVLPSGAREYHLGLALCCLNCACVTELDPQTGDLYEFPRWRLADLTDQWNCQDLPRTSRTLGLSRLILNES